MEFEQMVLLGLGATVIVIYLKNSSNSEKTYSGRYKTSGGEDMPLKDHFKEFVNKYTEEKGGGTGNRGFYKELSIPKVQQRLIKDCEDGKLTACQDYHKYFGGNFTQAE